MATADRSEYHRNWRLKNREHLKEYRKKYLAKYNKENKDKLRISKHRNKIKKDPDYEYKTLQKYFNDRNPYETIL